MRNPLTRARRPTTATTTSLFKSARRSKRGKIGTLIDSVTVRDPIMMKMVDESSLRGCSLFVIERNLVKKVCDCRHFITDFFPSVMRLVESLYYEHTFC